MDGVLCPVQRHAEQHSCNPRFTRWESTSHVHIISLWTKTRSASCILREFLMLEMEENIQNCLQCYRVCLRTFSHLLTLEPDAGLANPEQLHLLLVCADVCRMCAEFYARFSEFHPRAANLCCVVLPAIPAVWDYLRASTPVVRECASTCAG